MGTLTEKAKKWLYDYPDLYLKAKAFSNRRSLMTGIRLNTYAIGKSCLEEFTDLGVGKGWVEIDVHYTAMNSGTERANFLGLPNTKFKFPANPGGSGLGKVVKVGSGVKGIKKGDLVAGAFQHATRVVLQSSKIAKLKPGVPTESATFMHLAIIALQGVRMGQVTETSKVAVLGQGIVGRLATLICRGIGAETTVVTRSRKKLDHFKETTGIALADDGGKEALARLNADIIIDASGNPDAVHDCVSAVAGGGAVVLLGSSRGITKNLTLESGSDKKFRIVGAHIRNIGNMPKEFGGTYAEEADFLQDLMLKGKLSVDDILTKRIKGTEFSAYYNTDFVKGLDSGVLVDWTDKSGFQEQLSTTPSYDGPPTFQFDKRLNIAMLGCGGSGFVHANAIKEGSSFTLHTVMDVNLEMAKKLGEAIGAAYTTNYDDILNNKDIDVVLVASPHFLHKDQAVQAAKSGKHVIVDKPLAITTEEGKEAIEAAMTNNVLIGTFHQRVFEPTQEFAKLLFDQDAVGEIIGVSMEYQRDKPTSYWLNKHDGQLSWRANKELSGGGFLVMNLIHEIDYFRYMTGLDFASVFANAGSQHHPIGVEDFINATVTLSNGATGTITGGSAVKGHGGQRMRIWGHAGQVIIDENRVKFYSHKKLGDYDKKRWHTVRFEQKVNTRRIYFDDFRRRLEAGEKTSMDERGYEALKTVEAFYESSEKKQPVTIR